MFKKFLPLFLLILSVSSLHAQTVAYVTNVVDGTVSVINTSTNTVTATIGVGSFPTGMAFSPDGTRAYVTNLVSSTISVIDTASNTVVTTVPLPGGGPAFLAITPDGKTLYVPSVFGNVLVVSTAILGVTASIPLPGFVAAVAVTPDGAHAYVAGTDPSEQQGLVFVVDTSSNTVVATISANASLAGEIPLPGIEVTPGGGAVYEAGGFSFPDVPVIATASNSVTTTIPVPGGIPTGLAITPDGSRVYVSDFAGNAVNVIATATNTVVGSPIPVGSAPWGLAATPDGAFVYVADLFGGTVSVISTTTNAVVATVPVGGGPIDVAIANLTVPFASFPAPTPSSANNPNRISLTGSLALGANSPGIDFAHQPMTLTVGGFSLTFPPGTVTQVSNSPHQQHFNFSGTLNGLSVTFDLIGNSPNFTYSFIIQGTNVGTQVGPNPVTVSLAIGKNSGSTTVNF